MYTSAIAYSLLVLGITIPVTATSVVGVSELLHLDVRKVTEWQALERVKAWTVVILSKPQWAATHQATVAAYYSFPLVVARVEAK